MTDMITKDKKYRTRDGREPKGLTPLNDEEWGFWLNNSSFIVQSNGKIFDKLNSFADLIEVKEKHEGWVNVYIGGGEIFSALHPTRKEADECSDGDRIACIKIEYEEGEGI
jgi:hypothetical protein